MARQIALKQSYRLHSLSMRRIPACSSIALILIASLYGQFNLCSQDQSADENALNVTNVRPVLSTKFSDEQLPRSSTGDQLMCYDFLGCIRILPISMILMKISPAPPDTLGTEFVLSDRSMSMVIKYERTKVCLNSTSFEECEYFPYDIDSLLSSPFDPERRTVILIGGYRSKKNCSWQNEVAELWFKIEDINLIKVRWTEGNSGFYFYPAANTKILARQITVLLYYLAKLHGTSLMDEKFSSNIYIIGHSLGAHAAAFVGQDFDGKIGRITGLDPAGPAFSTSDLNFRLDRTDAIFVDVIHTNAGASIFSTPPLLGTSIDSGHIDIYANDGVIQPGCSSYSIDPGCSHRLATTFYHLFLKHAHDSAKMDPRERKNSLEYKANRLLAYKANNFAELALGISLAELCPITALQSADMTDADLPRCSIPIDFTAKPHEYKKELATKHGLILNSYHDNDVPINKYFFRTFENQSVQSYHYLLRIVVTNNSSGSVAHPKACDITVEIDRDFDEELSLIANGPLKLSHYDEDRYAILVPFIVVDPQTKTHILTLEYDNYYEGESDQTSLLKDSLLRIMPRMVILSDRTVSKERRESSGIFDFVKYLPELAQGWIKNSKQNCNLHIESVSIEVLKTSRRHQIAYYSYNKVPEPDLSMIDTNSTAEYTLENRKPVQIKSKSTFYLNKLIIGPSVF